MDRTFDWLESELVNPWNVRNSSLLTQGQILNFKKSYLTTIINSKPMLILVS